jgi:hypothetical protein
MHQMSYQSINISPKTEGDESSDGNVEKFLHFDNDELDAPPLPATIYTSTIVCALGFEREELCSMPALIVIFSNWAIISFYYAFAYVILTAIRALRDESPECVADYRLIMIGVIAFSTYCAGEIFETFSLLHWIHAFPTSEFHEPLKFSSDDSESKQILSGMTQTYKLWLYISIILPKFIIGVALPVCGNTFLLTSDTNQDVILNAMALGFITQQDEIMYNVLVPQNICDILEGLPSAKISYRTKMMLLYKPLIMSLFIFALAIYCYSDVCWDDQPKPIQV